MGSGAGREKMREFRVEGVFIEGQVGSGQL